MKQIAIIFLVLLFVVSFAEAQNVRIATAYNYPLGDTLLPGLKSIRGCAFSTDMDGDGKSEIAVTNYSLRGRVHLFETVGDDSIKMVWISPPVPIGGGSTPRTVCLADLDNDGKKEVIFQSSNQGIYIFEWDGVVGSDNYGDKPSQIITTPDIAKLLGSCEYMEVSDIDGDGANELSMAMNAGGSDQDRFYIFSASGDWSTGDPGFSSFNVEFSMNILDGGPWGLWSAFGASPYALVAGNLDGTGNKEIIVHAWHWGDITIMRVPSANTYVLADTLTGKANVYLGGLGFSDDVALFGGMAYDIDKDGRDEVYLPIYYADTTHSGRIAMISYKGTESTSMIDSAKNVYFLSLRDMMVSSTGTHPYVCFGYGYGDIDGNGKTNIYTSSTYPYNLVSIEFQGGDIRNLANWTPKMIYPGDKEIFTALTIKDSASVKDTLARTIDPSFVSKLYGRNTDFDKDGKEDIIMPYQALSDSISMTKYTWNAGTSKFDTTKYKVANPKRWGLRILEKTTPSGIGARDLTIISPDDYKLEQNYPNPFNPSTTIKFTLPIKDRISLKIYDELGREVRTLINNADYPKGKSEITWNGKNNQGKPVSSGVYFYTLRFGNFQKSMKMTLVK